MFEKLKSEITVLIENSKEVNQTLTSICDALKSKIPHYDWVGFYFKNDKKRELILGPYAGKPTDHSTIPFGRGICGQVAVNNKNFVVPDVQAQDNYIACSLEVKSEIVIPIFVKGENIGQIDIDSNTLNPFSKADETFLEFICAKVATLL
ncbi:MAG: GAF domain-containing protein [Bacteroidota bacterium]|nr:GAF domain-containing protein [Bacteroidota bacterium]MEC8536503.1 GAF domain-containing protein [Bacteroidota bacterium]MEC8723540.1 GAF domain-containing protein [Bacteroidota bacterium]